MFESPIAVGVVAWALTALAFYVLMRRSIYSLFDPLVVVMGISAPFSAALLAVLCAGEFVSPDKLILFSCVLLAYLVGGRVAGAFFGRETFRQTLSTSLSRIRSGEITAILMMTCAISLVVAVLAVRAGAAGDARQEFSRLFRPFVLVQNGLFLFSLLLLLSPRLRTSRVTAWLVCLVVLSVPFSGKGVLIPLVFWFGLRMYLQRRPITLRAALMITVIALLGSGLMVILAYRSSGALSAFLAITQRFWMSGDVYILAYQSDGLAAVRGNYPVTFLAYMMHPITALVGMRAYDKPLGAMLASAIMKDDVLTGPNPQLPVVLDYFFPGDWAVSLLIAFIIGVVTLGIRPLGMAIATRSRSRYLCLGGLVAAVFCPAEGFLDASLVLISLVGVVATTFLLVALELLLRKPAAPQPAA